MIKEELEFDSRDNETKIRGIQYTPEDKAPIMVVQIIHGMAETAERYEPFAEFLTSKGCVVVINEHLGHGKSVKEGNPLGYFCDRDPATVVVRDVHRLKKNTQNRFTGLPYVIVGHSMGSYILRNYIEQYGKGIDAAVLSAPGYQSQGLLSAMSVIIGLQSLLFGEKHVAKFLDQVAFGKHNARITKQRTNFDWLSRDEKIVDAYIADPLCGFTFTVNGFRTLKDLASRAIDSKKLANIPAKLPIMILSGNQDPVGSYGQAVPKIVEDLNKVGVEDITVKMYPECRHELLNEPEKEEVMQDIFAFLSEKVPV